jgi:hypothetical protein
MCDIGRSDQLVDRFVGLEHLVHEPADDDLEHVRGHGELYLLSRPEHFTAGLWLRYRWCPCRGLREICWLRPHRSNACPASASSLRELMPNRWLRDDSDDVSDGTTCSLAPLQHGRHMYDSVTGVSVFPYNTQWGPTPAGTHDLPVKMARARQIRNYRSGVVTCIRVAR